MRLTKKHKKVKVETITRTTLTEKAPFYVAILSPNKEEYSGETLVRNCTGEDDLKKARSEYDKINKRLREDGHTECENLSYNPNKYYFVLEGGVFVGNIVDKIICKRIKKQTICK